METKLYILTFLALFVFLQKDVSAKVRLSKDSEPIDIIDSSSYLSEDKFVDFHTCRSEDDFCVVNSSGKSYSTLFNIQTYKDIKIDRFASAIVMKFGETERTVESKVKGVARVREGMKMKNKDIPQDDIVQVSVTGKSKELEIPDGMTGTITVRLWAVDKYDNPVQTWGIETDAIVL